MSTREPISDAHRELGSLLRSARKAANVTTRGMSGYSSGHVSNVENGHIMPSSELIAVYEQLGADRLALRVSMEAARKATEGKRGAKKFVASSRESLTAESDPNLIRSRYRVVEAEYTYYLDRRGVITHFDSINFIRALEPTRFLARAASYPSDRRPGVLSFSANSGGRLVRQTENSAGATAAIFDVGRELSPSDPQPHRITCRVTVNSEIPALPILKAQFVAGGVTRYAVRIQFTAPAMPKEIWWFRKSFTLFIEPDDPDPEQMLETSQNGIYSHEFYDLAGNEHCGLSWLL